MFIIVGITSNIVIARFNDRAYANAWLLNNNTDEVGEPLSLFKLVKDKA